MKKIAFAALLAFSPMVILGSSAETPTSESVGDYIDDSAITAKVKAAILQDDSLKVLQIQVKTYKGTVQLSGFVDSVAMVGHAGTVAHAVPGVTAVKNDLLVK